MYQYCLFERPADFPDMYVLREIIITDVVKIGEIAAIHPTKEYHFELMARKGFVFLMRDEADNPNIIGTFI